MAGTITYKNVAIDPALHHRVDVYATSKKMTIKEVVATALKLYLGPNNGKQKG